MSLRAIAVLIPLTLSATAIPSAGADPSDAIAGILPHRAVYSYALAADQSATEYLEAAGEMATLWSDDCSGWVVEQKSRMLIERTGGVIIDFGWSMESWESKDGLQFRYFLAESQQGNVTSQAQGRAKLNGHGEAGEVEIRSGGESATVELLPGTVFPTWHSLDVIDGLREERLPLWHILFDGADEPEALSGVSTFQIGERTATPEEMERFPSLAGQELHRIALAFFPMQADTGEPDHEMELTLALNGVVTDFLFDFGDFAVRATLESLEPLAPPSC